MIPFKLLVKDVYIYSYHINCTIYIYERVYIHTYMHGDRSIYTSKFDKITFLVSISLISTYICMHAMDDPMTYAPISLSLYIHTRSFILSHACMRM